MDSWPDWSAWGRRQASTTGESSSSTITSSAFHQQQNQAQQAAQMSNERFSQQQLLESILNPQPNRTPTRSPNESLLLPIGSRVFSPDALDTGNQQLKSQGQQQTDTSPSGGRPLGLDTSVDSDEFTNNLLRTLSLQSSPNLTNGVIDCGSSMNSQDDPSGQKPFLSGTGIGDRLDSSLSSFLVASVCASQQQSHQQMVMPPASSTTSTLGVRPSTSNVVSGILANSGLTTENSGHFNQLQVGNSLIPTAPASAIPRNVGPLLSVSPIPLSPFGPRTMSTLSDNLRGAFPPSDGRLSSGSALIPAGNFAMQPFTGQGNGQFPHQAPMGLRQVSPEVYMERFESHMRQIANDINSTVQMHVNGLCTRRDQLISQLETIKKVYMSLFQSQRSNRNANALPDNDFFDAETLAIPSITFTKPDHALYKALTTMGFLTAPAFAPYCSASGDGLEAAIPGQNLSFIIFTKNCFNEELLIGKEVIALRIVAIFDGQGQGKQQQSPTQLPHPRSGTLDSITSGISSTLGDFSQRTSSFSSVAGSTLSLSSVSPSPSSQTLNGNNPSSPSVPLRIPCPYNIVDHNNGKYTVTYSLPPSRTLASHVEITVLINGLAMSGCPFKVAVQTQQKQTWKRLMTYGTEGNELGQFCRPWGVAITAMPCNFTIPQPTQVSPTNDPIPPMDHFDQPVIVTATSPGPPMLSTGSPQQNCDSDSTISPLLGSSSSSLSPGSSTGTNPAPQYLIAVADRSNNRIQVLKFDMATLSVSPLFAFGSGPGTRQGQFDRPAGLCFNLNLNQIIVADKDNHRIQVFDLSGHYLFKFGEKGNRAGQFCYPWDVESCPKNNQIIVSDTRNRRVQVFTAYGQYVMHFAQPLDSPRGVAFLGENRIVVSDFNKHRLLIFDRNHQHHSNNGHSNGDQQQQGAHAHHSHLAPPTIASSLPATPTAPGTRFIGFGEGSGWGEFLRPQGIAISGNYAFCSDSRNNRICLYNSNSQSFEYLSEDLALDRPSGIAVIDNLMIVVDFGNNRLQVCTR